jgi:hypothetical protein
LYLRAHSILANIFVRQQQQGRLNHHHETLQNLAMHGPVTGIRAALYHKGDKSLEAASICNNTWY